LMIKRLSISLPHWIHKITILSVASVVSNNNLHFTYLVVKLILRGGRNYHQMKSMMQKAQKTAILLSKKIYCVNSVITITFTFQILFLSSEIFFILRVSFMDFTGLASFLSFGPADAVSIYQGRTRERRDILKRICGRPAFCQA